MSSPALKGQSPNEDPATLGPRLASSGGRLGRIDPAAVARAEAALKGLASQFGQWLQAEVDKLQAARAAMRAQGLTAATADRLFAQAHDLKGLGTTYGFPIITRIASSLCKVLGETERRLDTPQGLVDAHADAILGCLRDNVRDVDLPAGRACVERLERDVNAFLGD